MIRLVVLFLLLLGACRAQPEQQPIAFDQPGKPALWRVANSKGGGAYLFGTVHLLPPDAQWQGPAIEEAVRSSDRLVLEVADLDDAQAVAEIFAQMGIAHGLPPFIDRIPPDLRRSARQMARDADIPLSVLDGMNSWAAALALASAANTDLGLSREAGAEHVLQYRFESQGKPVSGLETTSKQFGFFDALPEREQRALLADIVRNAGKGRASYTKMLSDWMAGRSDRLLDSANDGMLTSPVIRETLLDGRNRAWAAQIATQIEKGQHPFIAVGAGHLAGPGGVPELLKTKGYSVERIQ